MESPLLRTPRGRTEETRRIVAAAFAQGGPDRMPWLQRTLLRPAQVAALLQVSRRTVAQWARAGKLSWISTPGGHRRFRADDVVALVQRLTVTVPGDPVDR